MSKTKIEWTEVVWNPVTGCSKVSQGCKNCYAETIAKRFWGDRKFTDVICHEDRLDQPLHWKKPRMIFVNSMSDLFHEDVPFEFIEKVLDVMVTNPGHIYQILTKRPERLLKFCEWESLQIKELGFDSYDGKDFCFADFIWIGVSVEDQKTADERIPLLLQTPAAVRWISAEPLLEEISFRWMYYPENWREKQNRVNHLEVLKHINWVVCGGESGKNKRFFNPDWARKLRDECKESNVPFFMKQIDKIQPIPEDLMIREYPNE